MTTLGGFRFRVLRADSRRLHTLQVERIAPAPGDDWRSPTGRNDARARVVARACGSGRRHARCSRSRRFGVSGLGKFVTIADAAVLAVAARRSAPRWRSWLGFAFGLGLFGAGASWLTIALVTFGGMPAWLALIAIATSRYLPSALWPALAGYLAARLGRPATLARLVVAASAFTAAEWVRSYLFTGFPRLTHVYSQVPDGLVRCYPTLGRVYLVTLAVVLVAAFLAYAIDALAQDARRTLCAAAAGALAVVVTGVALSRVAWTQPSGPPLPVSLVQGNILQEMKFDPQFRADTFERYLRLVGTTRGRLIVLPESAFPVFSDEIPDAVLLSLIRTASARDGDVLLGLFTALPPEAGKGDAPRYYNTVVVLGTSDLQFYRKNHLVPFGETIPLKPILGWFIRSVLHIPLADQARGGAAQPALVVAGERVAVDICYEDAFGAGTDPRRARRAPARERDERCVVRPFDRCRAAQPDCRHARARVRTADAARDEHRHHVGDRKRRPRNRAPAVVHHRRARSRRRGSHGHDAVRAARRRHRGARALRLADRRGDRFSAAQVESRRLPVVTDIASRMHTFQQVVQALQRYWADRGCALLQPYDMEVGAGTSHTATFLRAIGPEPWRAAYVQPSRRPKDGRYGENPNRLQHYYQYQVVLKPPPSDILDLYLGSLTALGFDLAKNDVRFVEDDWENPTLGAWGSWLGSVAERDGRSRNSAYFQQVGGLDCNPITGEITYGLERLAMYLQGKENVFDLAWTTMMDGGVERTLTYGDVYHQNEVEQSTYNFEQSNAPQLAVQFTFFESEAGAALLDAAPRAAEATR